MKTGKLVKCSAAWVLLLIASGPLDAAGGASENSAAGSSSGNVKARFFDSSGIRPGANISEGKLVVEVQSVEFDPRWDAERWRQIDPDYEDRIRSKYSELFKEKLSAAFCDAGFTVVEQPEEATITVKASILRLQINAPELEGVSPNMDEPAGAGEMLLEFVRRSDQQLLARLTSYRRTEYNDALPPKPAKPGRNQHDFENLMSLWGRESAIYVSKPTTTDRDTK